MKLAPKQQAYIHFNYIEQMCGVVYTNIINIIAKCVPKSIYIIQSCLAACPEYAIFVSLFENILHTQEMCVVHRRSYLSMRYRTRERQFLQAIQEK